VLAELLQDLEAEQEALDRVVVALGAREFELATPAEGWTVRDQVSHLAFSEELAALAATDAEAFAARLTALLADVEQAESAPRDRARSMPPAGVLAWWRRERQRTVAALRTRDDRDRIPWITGEMSAVSFATARLMETWAHGQDIVDALGVTRTPTDRLRHIAHLGVATRGFSYQLRGLAVPSTPVRVELAAPAGDTWTWGPEGAPAQVTGPAEDFCLVVTQRRHVDDTGLVAMGDDASEWLSMAQAFAGPPGAGRTPAAQQAQ
jgi:uncharacterized protein (TIGR03084 family)